MQRLLVLAALAVLVYLIAVRGLRRFLASPTGRQLDALWRALQDSGTDSRSDRAGGGPARQDRLVRCSRCQAYVPRSRATDAGPGEVLCEACRR